MTTPIQVSIMNTPDTLTQEARNLHHQLALMSSAVVGHIETYGSQAEDVYTIAIYEQMTKSTQAAGRIVELLRNFGKPEPTASHRHSIPETAAEPLLAQASAIEDRLCDIIDIVRAYENLGLENNSQHLTGHDVSVLMGVITDKLNSIRTLFRKPQGNAIA